MGQTFETLLLFLFNFEKKAIDNMKSKFEVYKYRKISRILLKPALEMTEVMTELLKN